MTNTESLRTVLARRRAEQAQRWDLGDGFVLIPSGSPAPIPGSTLPYAFRVHPEHFYLTGLVLPGQVLAYDPGEGWTLFGRVATVEERVWEGAPPTLDELSRRAGLDRVRPREELADWVHRRGGRDAALAGSEDLVQQPAAYGLESLSASLSVDSGLGDQIRRSLSIGRRRKDAYELDRMRESAAATAAGHLMALRTARPGMTERELQIEIEASFYRAGGERTAYDTIVGVGDHGAVLHFLPTDRPLRDGDLLLVDAGAERGGYASDVTRTWPVAPSFLPEQHDLYEVVLAANKAAIALVRPGVEYRDIHLAAAAVIAEGLVEFGLLHGDPESLVDRDVHALFFPHGVGHLLGLRTHDVGGDIPARKKSTRFGLDRLRTNIPLEKGYVVTIEPGIYFIEALLGDPSWREKFAQEVDWEKVDSMLEFGGIRVEDNIVVTESGGENLTAAVPKGVAELESLRKEAVA